ncbi:hypothetical protein [Nitrososphaera sp. AFS]|uniref:hypothetical protein n=1 Tax=Nitrososphaera sp. AFS TaxID=2301191 RepID=UPI00139225A8|nr:hypothetical protein [Nitrososphaera sp. AFS]
MKFGFRSAVNFNHFSYCDTLLGRSCVALLPLLSFASLLLILSFASSFNYTWGQTSSNHTTVGAVGTGTNNSTNQPQMITNISKQGTYKVEIQWHTPQNTQTAVFPKNGFQLEVRFLNGTAPSATSKNIPNKIAQGGVTTIGNGGTQYAVPGSIEHLLPINSYDMTILDDHGHVLWHKANQTTSAGIGQDQVVLTNGYTGKIHILINNIQTNNAMTGSNITPLSTPKNGKYTQPQNAKSDSVDLIAQIR